MKNVITNFKCDTCGKEESRVEEQGFPYELDWEYLYKFNGQTPADTKSNCGRYDEEDKHFCGKECMFRFIEQTVNIAGGLIKKTKHIEEVAKESIQEIEDDDDIDNIFDAEEPVVKEPAPIQTKLTEYELEEQKLQRAKSASLGEVKEPLTTKMSQVKKGILQQVEDEINAEKRQVKIDSEDSILFELGIEK